MSMRLKTGGRLVNRASQVEFNFNGKRLFGHEGDMLASALLANDQMLVGRSFKYHRPRGIVASGAEEPNALMNMGEGAKFEPNQRATTTELFEGLSVGSQNHWPSLEYDIGAVNGLLARFLSAGFYYKMFIHPRPFWKHIYEPFIRQSAAWLDSGCQPCSAWLLNIGIFPGRARRYPAEHFVTHPPEPVDWQ